MKTKKILIKDSHKWSGVMLPISLDNEIRGFAIEEGRTVKSIWAEAIEDFVAKHPIPPVQPELDIKRIEFLLHKAEASATSTKTYLNSLSKALLGERYED